jgi:hypothetical protein
MEWINNIRTACERMFSELPPEAALEPVTSAAVCFGCLVGCTTTRCQIVVVDMWGRRGGMLIVEACFL